MRVHVGDGQHKVQERILGSFSMTWRDYKGLPNLREESQHGYQMEKQDLSREPMSRKALPLA